MMTREMTTTRQTGAREISDWITISPLTRWVRGMASVGLNATTLVYANVQVVLEARLASPVWPDSGSAGLWEWKSR